MSWHEACWLLNELAAEWGSHTHAAIAGWDFPASREWILQAQHVDDYRQAHSKRRVRAWPRPWPSPGVNRLGAKKPKITNPRELLRRLAGR